MQRLVTPPYGSSSLSLGAALLLCACKVYLPPCQGNEDPPVGVTVHRVSELDDDGGEP